MTEILTESFCERCGTRYTFESERPRVRLKGVKVLSRGLKNFVLSDDTSIDEAMAAARSESDREASAHQLDAFHKTFSFCMSCRQYTCPNCWNEAEARCLSCAPLAFELAPAVELPQLRDAVLIGDSPGNGTALLEPEVPVEVAAEGSAGTLDGLDEAPEVGFTESIEADLADAREALDAPGIDEAVAADAAVPTDEVVTGDDGVVEDGDAAGKAVSQTLGLLRRFRPGQSLDAELDAFERERVDAVPTGIAADTVATDDLAALQADRIAAASQPEEPDTIEAAALAEEPAPTETDEVTEPLAAAAPAPAEITEPEPELAPEPMAATAPELEPEPAPEQPVVPPIAAASASDVVEQPTWRITAPDPGGPAPGEQPTDHGGSVPVQASGPPARPSSGEPQWPAKPEWPNATASAGLPFLGRPATPQGGIDALWAASNQELVTAPPLPGKTAVTGIQPCISCGLSLSATARFCRRCGTLQSR